MSSTSTGARCVAAASGASMTATSTPAALDLHQHHHHPNHHQPSQPPPPPPPPPPQKMPGCVWTNEAVTLLLSLYLREQQLARPQKLKKKDVWRGICAELWRRGLACSWQECDKKYRNLKQTFVRNLKQAGKKECRWMFFPLMLEINRHEPFVGDALVSGGGVNTASAGSETSDAMADAVSATYTPAASPTVMNLSQRQSRSPSPPPPLSPAATWTEASPAPKRRCRHLDSAAIKLESSQPTLQTHLPAHPQHQRTTIKRSTSPGFDRPLVPLDIRLLQAAMPFVTHSFAPASQTQQHQQPQLQPIALVSTMGGVPTSPSTLVSTLGDEEDDVDDDDDDDEEEDEEEQDDNDGNAHLSNGIGGKTDDPPAPDSQQLQQQQQQQQQQPPKWFSVFMAEFRRHEQRKLQQIAELCAEVRRTNDIEQQRNHILGEKNEILRHMNAFMLNK